MAKLKLNTEVLVQLRVARQLTAAALADRIELLSKTWKTHEPIKLSTIERHEKEKGIIDVHEGTIAAYAAGLNVPQNVLTGEVLTPEQLKEHTYDPVQELKATSKLPDGYETRLIKCGEDNFMLVEFTSSNSHGRIIAKDIPDAEAGGRLSSYSSLMRELNVAFHIMKQINLLELEPKFFDALVQTGNLLNEQENYYPDRFIGADGQQIPGLEALEWLVKLSTLIETGESFTGYSDSIFREAERLLYQKTDNQ